MSSLEIELQQLKESNNELVKKVQFWKMTAAQREKEKLDLMKEINDLRLQLSGLRSGGAEHARKLDSEIQAASKQALTHLVQASSAVTRTVQLVKTYMQDAQDMERSLPRWSSIGNTPSTEKVHRVLPMLIGGQSIQPVVSLSRTMVNVNNSRANRRPNNNENHNPVPMHMLQDLYIPLTRIDANGLTVNIMDGDPDEDNADLNNSAEDLGLDDSVEQSLHESQNVSDAETLNESQRLAVIEEDPQLEDEVQPTPKPRPTENPLEGPSWMLDVMSKSRKTKSRVNLEPDSTTECDEVPGGSALSASALHVHTERERLTQVCEFSPTVRRRKRTSSPHSPHSPHLPHLPHLPHSPHTPHSPRPPARRNSNSGRILKVLVSKLRLEEDEVSPPKRPLNSPSRPSPRESLDGTKRHRPSPSPRESLDGSKRHRPSPSPRESVDGSKRHRPSPMTSPARRGDKSPGQRLSRDAQLLMFDAPSPNGATTSHVVVSETTSPIEAGGSGEPAAVPRRVSKHVGRGSRDAKHDGRSGRDAKHDGRSVKQERYSDTKHDSHDSDSGSSSSDVPEGRTRRQRKPVTYKEKPLNRKMRR